MQKLIVIKTQAQLEELCKYLEDKDFVAFDTETTGVTKESQIIGYSVCADPEVGYYVILKYWDTATESLVSLDLEEGTKALLRGLVDKSLIMHNGVFDSWMVQNNFGIVLMPSLHTDTMLLAHIINENRAVGLKELGTALYGEDAHKEQALMKESVLKNGGVLTKEKYELYKADADLLAEYGAKDAILTLKLFYELVPQLYEQGLDDFFYNDETMPLLRGPTYDLNTTGLRIDPEKLQDLKGTLQAECLEAEAFIRKEIATHIQEEYPGTSKAKTFNIGASKQLAWLLFVKLGNSFNTLTDSGKEICKFLNLQMPYTLSAKREFIEAVRQSKDIVYCGSRYNPKTGKTSRPKKIAPYWHYFQCGKESLGKLANKYKWVETLLEYKKNEKLLTTYVEGIQSRMQYNVIRPSFLQHGTTSGRYSSKAPNFQNLPRDDKRVKSCIVARPGNVFVGADYSQLEPRVFASVSKDSTLLDGFKKGEDFYSVVGAPIFGVQGCSLFKEAPGSFAKKYPKLRDKSKVVALATPYGRTAHQQSMSMGISKEEAQMLIDKYFDAYPQVELMMLESHEQVKKEGVVYNLFGRPRRIPEAMNIVKLYGNRAHADLPYAARTLLNLSMNHRVQSTGASIMNRAAIALWKSIQELAQEDPRWHQVKIVMQVHDELILEGPKELADDMAILLKDAMENTVALPGVDLIAEPKIALNIADLK